MNRRRPSCETPLGLGAKKDGCFCRLGFKCKACVHKSEYKVIRLVAKRGFACSQDYRIQGHFLKSLIRSGLAARQSYYIACSKKEEGI